MSSLSGLPGPASTSFGFIGGVLRSRISREWRHIGAGAAALGLGFVVASLIAERGCGLREGGSELLERARELTGLFSVSSSPFMALSLHNGAPEVVEAKTSTKFATKSEEKVLVVTGVRTKKILGLKSITAYAFGVYVDPASLKATLGNRYGTASVDDLKKNPEVLTAIQESDVAMTVRLSITFSQLSAKTMRSSLEESVGKSLKKYSKADESALLNKFLDVFTSDLKLEVGSIIEIARHPGQILKTSFNGRQIGSVESSLLTKAFFNLYIGEDAVDKTAKEQAAEVFPQIFKS